MRLDQDTKERIKVGLSFCLEAYKMVCGCFLSVFVPHTCNGGAECSVSESFQSKDPILLVNGGALLSVCCLYAVELSRENWLIETLDIDPTKPDTYLRTVAPLPIQTKLLNWNKRYWQAAAVSMGMTAVNLVLSGLYLSGRQPSFSSFASFSILVLMKLVNSFTMARKDKRNVRARSAYMTEHSSFNVLDKDVKDFSTI